MDRIFVKYPRLSGLVIFLITTILLFIFGLLFIRHLVKGATPKDDGAGLIVYILGILLIVVAPVTGLIVGFISAFLFVRKGKRLAELN